MLVAELDDGIAGYVKLGQALPIAVQPPRARDQGPRRVDPAAPPPRRRPRARCTPRSRAAREAGARRLTLRVLAHNADARSLYAACGFEIEGVLRELFQLDGRYVDDVLMALDLTLSP